MSRWTPDETRPAATPIADPTAPLELAADAWPTAELDTITRMRAIAAALPHVVADETVFDVPFERFWSTIADLEHSTPLFEGTVTRLRVLERDEDRLRLDARSPLGVWLRFDAVLREGWCLMHSRLGDVGMAARPEPGDRTRFYHFEGSSLLGRLARPFFARNIRGDFRRLQALFDRPD